MVIIIGIRKLKFGKMGTVTIVADRMFSCLLQHMEADSMEFLMQEKCLPELLYWRKNFFHFNRRPNGY